MKELHNHIFSNTTCISKETMLKFINKQLSKEELHKVETHMLDCELCTDAYEGMAYAENSSILFAIDSQIDQRVGKGNFKAPIMRNLMVAASILVIVFGTYFTFSFFNKTVNSGNNLAINKVEETKQQPLEEIFSRDFEENNQKVVIEKEKKEASGEIHRSDIIVAEPVLVKQIIEEDEEDEALFLSDAVADEEVEEIEQEELLEDVTIVISGNISNDFNEPEITTKANKYYGYVAPSVDEKGDILSEKAEKQKNRSKSNKKSRFKPVVESSSFVENSTEDSDDELRNQNNEKILIIEDYKVINYLEEYQASYDTENEKSVELNSVSAGFESKLDKDLAGKEQQESIVEVTYKETLDKAIRLYKKQKYNQAITQFDLILAAHPEEVNGLFYKGMSYYNLERFEAAKKKFSLVLNNKETEFNPEANWYKVLCLIELKETAEAKKLLKEIVVKNGFYKTKAEAKLKGL